MKYIPDEDYIYISNKYYDTTKPFISLMRLTRNDSIFDPDTGLAPDLVQSGIFKNDEKYKNRPHSIRKARALEYALDNTRIACYPRDIFPAINCTDRPVEKTLVVKWTAEVFEKIIRRR